MKAILAACAKDWALAKYLRARTERRAHQFICRRISDDTLWAASHPQDFGEAMLSVMLGGHGFHFVRLREWRGLLIAAPRIFWQPAPHEFRILFEHAVFRLPPWPEEIETAKIRDQRSAGAE